MNGLMEIYSPELVYDIAYYAGEILLRVVPLLVAAVFLAESARLWLGEEKLKILLSGRHPWTGRLRALVLGALLPFCECGAFPVLIGLMRAGVPAGVMLTFFLVSPVVSMPAFMILMGLFGLPFSLFYLLITSAAALLGSFFLETAGTRWGMFKEETVVTSEKSSAAALEMACSSYSGNTGEKSSCCSTAGTNGSSNSKEKFIAIAGPAWEHTVKLLRRVLPYLAVIILVSALLRNLVPQNLIQQALAARAPFDIIIAALIGIPIYSGDCSMIAIAAPLIGATGAVGAGIAFIISGSGTSINGIIFMNSVFKLKFLVFYISTVICIAILVGYLVSGLLAFGII